jgi:hypothetical protein
LSIAACVAAVGLVAERASGWGNRSIEALRLRLFSSQGQPAAEYDEPSSEISAFLRSCRRIFWGLAAFSGLSNLLMLTGSFFMLQIYDRVLPGRSIPTLIALLLLAIVLYAFQGGLDLVRSRIGVRIGRYFDECSGRGGDGDGLQPLRDLDQLRSFLSGGGHWRMLSVTDGAHTANIALLGQYSADNLTVAADDTTGTLLSFRDHLVI